MSDYIPDDILAEILTRPPLKSLLLFRCVSKSWRDLIDRSVEKINSLVIAQTGRREIGDYDYKKEFYAFDLVVNKGEGLFMANAKQLIISPPTTFILPGFWIEASCNGLLLLSLGGLAGEIWVTKHVLCNPFTCTYFELPSPPDDFTDDDYPTSLTLGYDHINDDYKVVVWFIPSKVYDLRDEVFPDRHELCVYSLKQKSWKPITDGIPFQLPKDYFLATYVFRKMSIFHLDRVYRRFKTMSCLNGCLSLVCNPEINGHYEQYHLAYGVADIWVMEEYGVESSWRRLASIDLPEEIMSPTPVAILGEGKKLLLKALSQKLVIYDIEKKSFSKVAIKGEADWLTRFCCCGHIRGCSGSCYYYDSTYWVCCRSLINPAS